MTLEETLRDPMKRALVVRDAGRLIEEEVSAKSGLRALALKAGYRTVLAVRPGIIEHVLDRLLPEFAPAVDPFYAKAQATGAEPRAYFRAHAPQIADALLSVTDRRAERAENAVLRRAYQGLRGQAKGHVEEALPRVAELIERHVR